MGEAGPFTSIQELLAHPTVKQADALELSICDIVHFRLVEAEAIFQLTELHLQKRDKDFYEGFAEIRGEVESAMRGSSVYDKISACCTKRHLRGLAISAPAPVFVLNLCS